MKLGEITFKGSAKKRMKSESSPVDFQHLETEWKGRASKGDID